MIYSYTQLSQYLACPRKYRYRYLEAFPPWSKTATGFSLVTTSCSANQCHGRACVVMYVTPEMSPSPPSLSLALGTRPILAYLIQDGSSRVITDPAAKAAAEVEEDQLLT